MKLRIFRSKTSFLTIELRILLNLRGPARNQAQSVDGSGRLISQMRPWMRPFLEGLYSYFDVKIVNGDGAESPKMDLLYGDLSRHRGFLRRVPFCRRLDIEIYTDAREMPPHGKDGASWESWLVIGEIP